MQPGITIIRGKITTLEVDAIANAANRSLPGDGDVYSYPITLAARISHTTIRDHFENNALPGHVLVVCFSEADLKIYLAAAKEIF